MTEILKTWGSSHQVTPRIKYKKTQKESKWVCLGLKERQALEARNRETMGFSAIWVQNVGQLGSNKASNLEAT